jgi:hypothetical protein
MLLPILTRLMGGLISNASVTIYPDSAHGLLFQYPVEFGTEVHSFSVGCGEGYLVPGPPSLQGESPLGEIATKQSGLLQSVSYRRV